MMRRPSMTGRGLGLSAALIVASLTLGGCEVVQRSRTAAFVNGQAISVQDVAETTRQYNQFLVTDQHWDRRRRGHQQSFGCQLAGRARVEASLP